MNMGKRENNILVLCANYYNESETLQFASEVLSQDASESVEVYVTDNTNREVKADKLSELSKQESRIRILYPDKNLGYLGAARFGLNEYIREAEKNN